MFYKMLENGYITTIGWPNVPSTGIDITDEKYYALIAKIDNKPDDTLEAIYRLSNDTEEYVACERTHDETVDWYVSTVSIGTMTLEEVPEDYRAEVEAKLPTEETKYTLDEAATLLAQEVNA